MKTNKNIGWLVRRVILALLLWGIWHLLDAKARAQLVARGGGSLPDMRAGSWGWDLPWNCIEIEMGADTNCVDLYSGSNMVCYLTAFNGGNEIMQLEVPLFSGMHEYWIPGTSFCISEYQNVDDWIGSSPTFYWSGSGATNWVMVGMTGNNDDGTLQMWVDVETRSWSSLAGVVPFQWPTVYDWVTCFGEGFVGGIVLWLPVGAMVMVKKGLRPSIDYGGGS